MSEQTIYLTMIEAGLTPEGAAGSIGNMFGESTLKANIAQRGMTNLSDEQYTFAADNNQIDFVHDSVGYGLCQWTYWSRKAELLTFAHSSGASVGDEHIQVLFYLKELNAYPKVLRTLTTSHNLKECSDIVCTDFERPAFNNLDQRYKYSLKFYEQFKDLSIPGLTEPSEQSYANPQINIVEPTIEPTEKVVNDQLSFNSLISNIANKIQNRKNTAMSKMPILKEGDSGPGVAAIQVALKVYKIDLGETGTLGLWESGTTRGLKDFQRKYGLTVTGQMDSNTWEKLMT